MIVANDRQVGGKHYASNYQHWDLVVATGMGYFEGQITRYVARWRKKNGLEDLRKAMHYLDKLIEVRSSNPKHVAKDPVLKEVAGFALVNELSGVETQIFSDIATWRTKATLQAVKVNLEGLMAGVEAKPVPLSEENHYSPRSGSPCDEDEVGW